ncbi:hypothetical protein [Chryseobacterium sp.]|uniref:hypothetical protein n=1 Tax=Chryseobacterium sp. TaxID=1871047 RepID=UPI0025BEA196|nr:hypothetical protein [Chryseobacterium sp.]
MMNPRNIKILLFLIIGIVCALAFLDRCTTVNITTSDLFRPKSYQYFKELTQSPESQNYEIVKAQGSFPILYDSIKNEFYLKNFKGLTKYDSSGNIIISNDLRNEKFTSAFDFANFIPYVFTDKGVYDFSGKKLIYIAFSKILNAQDEMTEENFVSEFRKQYHGAELVFYDRERNGDDDQRGFPIYFRIKDQWILLFSKKEDFTLKSLSGGEMESDTIGQIDFKNNPAKLSDKRLTLLKDYKNGFYSSQTNGERIDDRYLDRYYTLILKERKLDYQTDTEVEMLSRKKEDYFFTGSILDLPDWVAPSFINTGYFKLSYRQENIYFKAKAVKYFDDMKCENNLFLYELPKKFKKNSDIGFLDYGLNLGGYRNNETGEVDPLIKNTGLYVIRKKRVK